MAIEESKISDLIASYEKYEDECERSLNMVDRSRAALYRTVISDLEKLLPRKSIADLDVSDYDDLTGTIVECEGRRGVLLEGIDDGLTLFIFANKSLIYRSPEVIYPLDEERIWDEWGNVL